MDDDTDKGNQGDHRLTIGFSSEGVVGAKARLDLTSGRLIFEKDGIIVTPRTSRREYAQQGKNKLKTKTLYQTNGAIELGELKTLSRFNLIFAIDSAPAMIGADSITRTCFVPVRVIETDHGYTIEQLGNFGVFEFYGGHTDIHCEVIGWTALLDLPLVQEGLRAGLKIGILTDHDRNNHAAYNAGTLDIIPGTSLPENAQFIYATDQGPDIGNRLIKFCHNLGKSVTKDLEDGKLRHIDPPLPVENKPYTAYRLFESAAAKIMGTEFPKETFKAGPNASVKLYGIKNNPDGTKTETLLENISLPQTVE